jgi:zinc transporter ZupT
MASGNVSFAPRRTSVGRTTAGLLALAYPLLMVVMALAVGSREPGNLQDFAASFVAAVMLVIALPTTWFLSFDFIEVSRTTVVVFGLVTSLPLWYVLGTALAVRSENWGRWFRLYVTVAMAWTLGNMLLLAVVGALAGG